MHMNCSEVNIKGGFPGGAAVKNLPANAGDARDIGLIPGSGRSPERGNGYPLQYSCPENSTDRGAWWAIYSSWGGRELDTIKHKYKHAQT